jgi:hypothetical protein
MPIHPQLKRNIGRLRTPWLVSCTFFFFLTYSWGETSHFKIKISLFLFFFFWFVCLFVCLLENYFVFGDFVCWNINRSEEKTQACIKKHEWSGGSIVLRGNYIVKYVTKRGKEKRAVVSVSPVWGGELGREEKGWAHGAERGAEDVFGSLGIGALLHRQWQHCDSLTSPRPQGVEQYCTSLEGAAELYPPLYIIPSRFAKFTPLVNAHLQAHTWVLEAPHCLLDKESQH